MNRYRSLFLFILTAVFIAASGSANAQTLINATTYSYYGGATGSMVGIVPTQLIGPNQDNVASAVTDIGFTFWFAGTPYTQFSVDENGLMKLGSTVIVPEPINDMASTTNLPKIAPYWDDLATGTAGHVDYYLGGTAPNRYLIVQWNIILKNVVGTPAATFQARLYEGTGGSGGGRGSIFFKSSAAIATNAGGYSVGIGVSGTDFASVTSVTSSGSSIVYGTAYNNNTVHTARQFQFSTDNTAPSITALTLPTGTGTGNRTLTATITDAGSAISGIPTSGSFVPRVYYKKNADVSYVSTPGVLTSGNGTSGSWTFTIDHFLLGGVTAGDQIYYYIIAQDKADYLGSPNIASNPAGVVATNVNTVITPPASPLNYIIPTSFSGTKTVGVGGDYTSLTLAGGLFDQINAGDLSGNLTVNIISDLTAETGLKALNAWVNGPGGPFTLTINPVGNRIVSGITVNGGNGGVITLNGTTGVTIDGLNDGTNSLTFIQTGQYYVGSMIDIKGASNNTITRVTVQGYGASNAAITLTNSNAPSRPSSNNTVSYCNITTSVLIPNTNNTGNGITLVDWSGTTSTGNLNVIDHNTITNFVYNGILISGKYTNTAISNNDIYNTVGTAWNSNFRGISSGSIAAGITNIFNNKIHDLLVQTNTASVGIPAILSSGPAGTTTNIYNNLIYLDATFTHPMQTWYGVQTSGAGAVNIYYNSIYIGGTNITAATLGNSYGLYRGGTGTTNILDNAVFNARSNSTGVGKHYGIYITGTSLLTSNYNDIYINGTGGVFGFSTLDRLTLADWRTATSKDMNSVSGNPGFTAPDNLLPDVNNINCLNLDQHGIPIATIGTDILGNPRNTVSGVTDIGAYEFTPTVEFTISGNAGIAGATLSWTDGIPKTATANESGAYSFTVSYFWTGTVTPSLTGYTFTPANRSYSNVLADQLNQDYTPSAITFTISGNAGIAGATLSWDDGGPKTATADGLGDYSFTVSYNWSGTVTPSFAGYSFTPSNKVYTNVLADQLNQDYTVAPVFYTISGNAGIAGATLSWDDGGPKTATADELGDYSFTVSYNWYGTVTPFKAGFTFNPAENTYSNVNSNYINQDFVATPIVYTISGNTGTGGVTLSWSDVVLKPVLNKTQGKLKSDKNQVDNESFSLGKGNSKEDITTLVNNILNQKYEPLPLAPNVDKTIVSNPDGSYSFTVSYNWTGTVTPSLAGYAFNPVNKVYNNVLADQTAQDYTATSYIVANIKVFLEGPYSSGTMSTALRDNGFVPLVQPYNVAPYNYSGTESVTSIPAGVVDWVLLELRSDITTQVSRRAAFLKSDGSLVDLDGISNVKFPTVTPADYYIVIRHRNHLAIMSASAILLNSSSGLYDFSTSQSQAYGTNPMIALSGGGFGMIAADGNRDGGIYGEDYILYQTSQGSEGYLLEDYNLDGGVYGEDYILYQLNQGFETNVP